LIFFKRKGLRAIVKDDQKQSQCRQTSVTMRAPDVGLQFASGFSIKFDLSWRRKRSPRWRRQTFALPVDKEVT